MGEQHDVVMVIGDAQEAQLPVFATGPATFEGETQRDCTRSGIRVKARTPLRDDGSATTEALGKRSMLHWAVAVSGVIATYAWRRW